MGTSFCIEFLRVKNDVLWADAIYAERISMGMDIRQQVPLQQFIITLSLSLDIFCIASQKASIIFIAATFIFFFSMQRDISQMDHDEIIRKMITAITSSPIYECRGSHYGSTICNCLLHVDAAKPELWGLTCKICARRWPEIFPPITFLRRRKMMWHHSPNTPCVICHDYQAGYMAHFRYYCDKCEQQDIADTLRLAEIGALMSQVVGNDVAQVIMGVLITSPKE